MVEPKYKEICGVIRKNCRERRFYPLKNGYGQHYDRARPDSKIAYIETMGEASKYGSNDLNLCSDVKFLFVTLCAFQFSKETQRIKLKKILRKLFVDSESESLKKMVEKLLSIERTDDPRFFNNLLSIIRIANSKGLVVNEIDLLETLHNWNNAPERIAEYIVSQQEEKEGDYVD